MTHGDARRWAATIVSARQTHDPKLQLAVMDDLERLPPAELVFVIVALGSLSGSLLTMYADAIDEDPAEAWERLAMSVAEQDG